jgi:hypothetical protein
MAQVVNLVQIFNGTGSNSFNAAIESGDVKIVSFRNQGASVARVHIGGLSSPPILLNPRESVTLPVSAGDNDNTTYYVTFTGSIPNNCICIINKTIV